MWTRWQAVTTGGAIIQLFCRCRIVVDNELLRLLVQYSRAHNGKAFGFKRVCSTSYRIRCPILVTLSPLRRPYRWKARNVDLLPLSHHCITGEWISVLAANERANLSRRGCVTDL